MGSMRCGARRLHTNRGKKRESGDRNLCSVVDSFESIGEITGEASAQPDPFKFIYIVSGVETNQSGQVHIEK